MIEEQIARIIEPEAWAQYDDARRPYEENRGSLNDENFWYQMTWRAGCRDVYDVENWFLYKELEGTEPLSVFMVRGSLNKANAILELLWDER